MVIPLRKDVEKLKALASKADSTKVIRKIHEGICGNHSARLSLTQKILKQGYLWCTMKKDAYEWALKWEKCHYFTHIPKQPPTPLCTINVPRPFAKWRVEIIAKLPIAPKSYEYTSSS